MEVRPLETRPQAAASVQSYSVDCASPEAVRARPRAVEIHPVPGVVVVHIIVHERRELRALRDDLLDGDIGVLLRLEDDLRSAAAARNSGSGMVTARVGTSTGQSNLRTDNKE